MRTNGEERGGWNPHEPGDYECEALPIHNLYWTFWGKKYFCPRLDQNEFQKIVRKTKFLKKECVKFFSKFCSQRIFLEYPERMQIWLWTKSKHNEIFRRNVLSKNLSLKLKIIFFNNIFYQVVNRLRYQIFQLKELSDKIFVLLRICNIKTRYFGLKENHSNVCSDIQKKKS